MTLLNWLTFILLLQGPSTIEGMVVRADTGSAVANAQITLTKSDNPEQLLTVATNSEGQFGLKDVPPGTYRLFASRNGFARAEYGQRTLQNRGLTITLAAGQTLKDISLRLTPAGVVTGRVTSSTGEPLTDVSVELLRAEYNSLGKRTLLPVLSAKTDDRGEYRIFWITPGKYYVDVNARPSRESEKLAGVVENMRASNRNAGLPPGSRDILELSSLQNANQATSKESYPLTYYPGTTESSRAQQLDVRAGIELGGINIQLVQQPLTRIRGRVFDALGQPVKSQGDEVVLIAPENPPMYATIGPDSVFELRNVPPGSYTLRTAGSNNEYATTRIDVVGANIDNVILTKRFGATVSGQIRFDGVLPSRMGVQLIVGTSGAGKGSRINANGTFTFNNVFPGQYWVELDDKPAGIFIKEARLAGTDLRRDMLTIGDSTPGVLDLVLSNKPGQVEGLLVDAMQRPVGGVNVVLIPNDFRHRSSYYRVAVTDESGRFKMDNVIPADYKAFSWEDLEPYSYYEPEVLKKFEQAGTAVHVTESSSTNVSIKLIP